MTVKSPAEGGIVDVTFLNGKPETYYTNPENLTRAVPVEWGGTNLNTLTMGDILYAATDIGDGTFTQSMTPLPIGADFAVMISMGGLPIWSDQLTLDGLTVDNIQIAVSDDNTIDTVVGPLILDSLDGNVYVNDHFHVDGNVTI